MFDSRFLRGLLVEADWLFGFSWFQALLQPLISVTYADLLIPTYLTYISSVIQRFPSSPHVEAERHVTSLNS